jgi:hypothetical protein
MIFFLWQLVTNTNPRAHDWAIVIQKIATDEKNRALAPFNVQELRRDVAVTAKSRGAAFPNVTFRNSFILRNNIERFAGKTSLEYMLDGRFTLVVDLFQELDRRNGLVGRNTTATVTLQSDDWKDDMRPGAAVPREWHTSFAEQFLKQSPGDEAPGAAHDKTEAMGHFLSWVDWIQKALDMGSENGGTMTAKGA